MPVEFFQACADERVGLNTAAWMISGFRMKEWTAKQLFGPEW